MVIKMNIILGTMTFGEQIFEKDSKILVHNFLEYGYDELDTAYVYNNGASEQLIGMILKELPRDKVKIASKVNPRITGHLDPEAVRMQLNESLARLNTDYLDLYYLHFPDKNSPIEPVLEEININYKHGKIREFGLSNFPVELVQRICELTMLNGWIQPTVYEGLYNPLSRKIEVGLMKCLLQYNIRLNCYNPLAGGLLTDKYMNYQEAPVIGRFTYRPNYKDRYWLPSYFKAVTCIRNKCEQYGVGITEAAFRWLANSSMLNAVNGDGIIVGVSKLHQLKDNIKYINSEKLPSEIIYEFDKAWEISKEDAPDYFRFYEG